jgi:acetyl esterase
MPLHPLIAADLAAATAAAVTPYHRLPVHEARAQMKKAYAGQTPVPLAEVRNFSVLGPAGELPVRFYKDAPPQQRVPLVVFFHGSGFCALDLDTHDEICRRIVLASGCAVASVDYRLAPEHPFPAGPDDALAATCALAAMHHDLGTQAGALALAGDSAGACLAAVTALRLRDQGGTPAQALLMWYPVTDHPSTGWPSYERLASGYGLSAEGMRWFWSHYLQDPAQAAHPHVSPLRAPSLEGLPATWLMTAEYDPLHDEGAAFAERLLRSGVPTQLHCAQGLNHGFLKHAGRIPTAQAGLAQGCDWLRALFSNASAPALAPTPPLHSTRPRA